jgi:hypothetical protein
LRLSRTVAQLISDNGFASSEGRFTSETVSRVFPSSSDSAHVDLLVVLGAIGKSGDRAPVRVDERLFGLEPHDHALVFVGLPCYSPVCTSGLPSFQSVRVSTPKNHRLMSSGVVSARHTSRAEAGIVTEWLILRSLGMLAPFTLGSIRPEAPCPLTVRADPIGKLDIES